MLQKESGITLITLVVTIIVLIFLAGIATSSGINTIRGANKTAFISELEMIQAKVNSIYEKINSSSDDAQYYNSIGQPLSVVQTDKLSEVFKDTSQDGFKYYGSADLEKLGLDDIKQEVLINFNTREVISLTGFEIDGVTYYKLKDIPNYTGYNVEYVNKNTRNSNIFSREN